jgi:hypothetical protein
VDDQAVVGRICEGDGSMRLSKIGLAVGAGISLSLGLGILGDALIASLSPRDGQSAGPCRAQFISGLLLTFVGTPALGFAGAIIGALLSRFIFDERDFDEFTNQH